MFFYPSVFKTRMTFDINYIGSRMTFDINYMVLIFVHTQNHWSMKINEGI